MILIRIFHTPNGGESRRQVPDAVSLIRWLIVESRTKCIFRFSLDGNVCRVILTNRAGGSRCVGESTILNWVRSRFGWSR